MSEGPFVLHPQWGTEGPPILSPLHEPMLSSSSWVWVGFTDPKIFSLRVFLCLELSLTPTRLSQEAPPLGFINCLLSHVVFE